MKIQEAYMPFKGFETYYRIVNPQGKKTPLVLLHGGPGSTHTYFEVFDHLAQEDDRPLVMYDQIGCGNSFIEGHPEYFNAQTWKEELASLRDYLSLDQVHILGQSWGGMLQIYYHVEDQPQGVKSHIMSSTLSSARLWKEESHRRIKYLPQDMQEAIAYAEETGDYEDPAYLAALDEFMTRHSAGPYGPEAPEPLHRPRRFGQEAYQVGWGPNEFTPLGNLSGFEYTDRLQEIQVPVLVTSGTSDLSSPYVSKTIHDNLPHSEWVLFQHSRHMPWIDEHELYCQVLVDWLNAHD